jgi:hypothetical protein
MNKSEILVYAAQHPRREGGKGFYTWRLAVSFAQRSAPDDFA